MVRLKQSILYLINSIILAQAQTKKNILQTMLVYFYFQCLRTVKNVLFILSEYID